MKLLFFDDFKLGVLKGDTVVDVSQVVRDIPHTGPHDLISGLIERFAITAALGKSGRRRQWRAARRGADPAAAAQAGQHRLHGGELHGRRHAQGAGADQRVPQVAERCHRRRRHHGAARRARHHLRGRGGAGAGDRQARRQRARRQGDGIIFGYTQLHRRLGARAAARRQHVLPDEVARHLRADRPLYRHRRRNEGPAQSAGPAVGQRRR